MTDKDVEPLNAEVVLRRLVDEWMTPTTRAKAAESWQEHFLDQLRSTNKLVRAAIEAAARSEARTSAPADYEGWQVLAQDLAALDSAQYRQVAEWMIEHGWTEPLDPSEARTSAPEGLRERLDAAIRRVWEADHSDLQSGLTTTEGKRLADAIVERWDA